MSIGSGYIVFSDIYQLDNIVRNTAMMAGRNLLIDILREMFKRDREYRYVTDKFGFPKTPSNLGLLASDGKENERTTRLYIGGTHRQDISFLPAITVRPSSTTYAPISFNQNEQTVAYSSQKITDGYGNQSIINAPSAVIFAGAWEQSFEIKVLGRSLEDVLSIGDLILVGLQNTYRTILRQNGLFIKNVSSSGSSEENIGEADPIFSTSITVNTYSEWRREIPISNLVERIHLCFEVDISSDDIPATELGGVINIV
jgi:hypothetical protein